MLSTPALYLGAILSSKITSKRVQKCDTKYIKKEYNFYSMRAETGTQNITLFSLGWDPNSKQLKYFANQHMSE